MDRQEFLTALENASGVYDEQALITSLIERAKVLTEKDIDYRNQYVVTTIEELVELSEEELKQDRDGIIEESADVLICLVAVKLSVGITYDDIQNVITLGSLSVSPNGDLQKQLCKWLRGFNNVSMIASCMKNVMKHINTLKKDYGISSEEINKAINVKLARNIERTKDGYIK